MNSTSKFLILIACLLPTLNHAQQLDTFSVYYQASTNGMSGEAERHLIHLGENNYRLNMSLEAKVAGVEVADLEQASEFAMTQNGILPQLYSYIVSGITTDIETVSFNWDAKVALSTEEEQRWNIELSDSVLDEMSYQLAMALQLPSIEEGEDAILEFDIIDGPDIETLQFKFLGEEILQTPMGEFNAVKVQRVREESSGRSTIIWFARDWGYLLARIEQINSSGLRIELELKNALLNGEQVRPL